MGGIEHVKVGDHVRITEAVVNEGEVLSVRSDDTLVFTDGRWIDTEEYGNHHSVTVEVIEKPREIGWWEVDVDDPWSGDLVREVIRWDGSSWITHWSPREITPIHYIGKGSLDE